MSQLLRTKSIEALVASSWQEGRTLKRSLGPWSLTALGLGAVIGTGIFVLTGTAAAGETMSFRSILHAPVLDLLIHGPNAVSTIGRPGAGPAVSLSFILVAIACSFAALCFAELASMIPVAGSTYTYAYATLGEIIAWIIGWDLILEYAVSNMAVAVGFSAYFNDLLDNVFGFQIPMALSEPMIAGGEFTGAWFNPARAYNTAYSHLDSCPRSSRNSPDQWRHGADQAGRYSAFHHCRLTRRGSWELEAVHAQWHAGRTNRRRYCIFHLYRF